jgi:TatD DNase family protein
MPEAAIDSHAHIHFDRLADDMLGVLDRARAAGLAAIINVGTSPAENGRVVEMAAREKMLYAAIGFHPHGAAQVKVVDWPALEELARWPKVVALGEFGLDYHYKESQPQAQKDVFAEGLRAARRLDLPLVIHAREAEEDLLAVLDQAAAEAPLPRGVLHCFTGDADFARQVLARRFYISYSGVVTFKNAPGVREAAKITPLERLLVETDSPYCAPVPLRGKTNEPANVVYTIRFLADLYGLTEDDVRRITTRNAAHLFGLPIEAGGPCIVYPIRRSLYVNVTNECSNRCTFCPRSTGELVVKGHNLKLPHEPTPQEILKALQEAGAPNYEEVVFCGFGEPTLRLEVVKEVAREVKGRWGLRTRLDTNGQGSVINGRDITGELVGLVDAVSVSLNAPDAAAYEKLCRPTLPSAFAAVCEFVRACKGRIPTVRATAVAVPGLDLESVRRLAEQDLGVAFEVREYNVVG